MKTWLALADRTAVLFIGVAAGAMIGFAFADQWRGPETLPAPISVAPVAGAGTPAPSASGAAGPATSVAVLSPSEIRFGAQLVTTVKEGRPIRVGVFGDSFGDGVTFGLQQQLRKKAGFEVLDFSRQATGFTRYKSLNLETHAAELIGDDPIDVAVISYGANDTQGIIDRDGHYAALLSDGWKKEIGLRVADFVKLMRAHGAMVYWVGLPRMRKASFDADIMAMNAFYQAKMAELDVPFIDVIGPSSEKGQYAPYLPDPKTGDRTLIRADDGIHMSMKGYIWITRDLAARIQAKVGEARLAAGVPAPDAMPKTPADSAA